MDDYGIKPFIDIRNLWKDGDLARMLPGHDTVTYNFRWDVFCNLARQAQCIRWPTGALKPI